MCKKKKFNIFLYNKDRKIVEKKQLRKYDDLSSR